MHTYIDTYIHAYNFIKMMTNRITVKKNIICSEMRYWKMQKLCGVTSVLIQFVLLAVAVITTLTIALLRILSFLICMYSHSFMFPSAVESSPLQFLALA